MSGLFFPKENPTAGLLSTLAIFATGFGLLGYLLVTLAWRIKVVLARRRRCKAYG